MTRPPIKEAAAWAAIALMAVAVIAVLIAAGAYLSTLTPTEALVGVGVAWLTGLTIVVVIHNHDPKEPKP